MDRRISTTRTHEGRTIGLRTIDGYTIERRSFGGRSKGRATIARRSRALRTLILAGLAAAGCRDEEPTSPRPGPDGPDGPRAAVSAIPQLPPWLPPWASTFLQGFWNSLPTEAKTVWQRCLNQGKIGIAGRPYVTGVNCRLVLVDGYPRRYVVYLPNHPAVTSGADVPVVVMHHGSSGSGEQFLDISGWREEADQRGLIAIFPSGLTYKLLENGRRSTKKWNDFDLATQIDPSVKPPNYPVGAPWPADDVAFERTILDDAAASANVDDHRLYATGFSNGAGLTNRLAVELSDRLAATAAFAGGLGEEHTPVARIPVLLGIGSRDDRMLEHVNAQLLPGQDSITELPVDLDSLFTYVAAAGTRNAIATTFDLDPNVYTTGGDSTYAYARFATPTGGNPDGNIFILGVVKGVIHQYPRGTGRARPPNNPLAFDAARTFGAFFRTHPKP
jgi:polyhydroxybutyrate depolymerase